MTTSAARSAGRPLRVGIVGAGYIADWHAGALTALQGVELVAVADRSAGAARTFAERYGLTAHGDAAQMIAAERLDAVHVLTPPDSHAAVAGACLEAGAHVLVEKPVALSAAAARRLAATARRHGRALMAGHNFLGLPGYARLRQMMRAGRLGRVGQIEVGWNLPLAPLRAGPYGLWMLQGPANLWREIGPHLVAFAHDLAGPLTIEAVSASKPVALPDGRELAQSIRVLARAGAVDVSLSMNLAEVVDDRFVTVRGSAGMAMLDFAADRLVVRQENTAELMFNPARTALGLGWAHLREGLRNFAVEAASLNRRSPYARSFLGMAQAVYPALAEGRPVPDRFDAKAAVAVCETLDAVAGALPATRPARPRRRAKPPAAEVMVIGGTGYIGRHLVAALVEQGHAVRVASRASANPFAHLGGMVEVVALPTDTPQAAARAMEGMRVVVNLAKRDHSTWAEALAGDVATTETIGRAALEAGVARLIHTGTIASYDMSDPRAVITEATPFGDMRARNVYARAKAEGERRLQRLAAQSGLELCIIRPGIVVGRDGPLQHWGLGRWHGSGAVRLWGEGRNPLPFVTVDDVVAGFIAALDQPEAAGASFNLVGPPMLSARDWFDAIATRTGARIRVVPGPLWPLWAADGVKFVLKRRALGRKDATRATWRDWKSRAHLSRFDNSLPRQVLGWEPIAEPERFLDATISARALFGF